MNFIALVLAGSGITSASAHQDEQHPSRPNAVEDDRGSDFGGAIPIATEDWLAELQLPELQYVPSFVLVAFEVTEDGETINCRALEPEPSTRFVRQEICGAIEQHAKFKPARNNEGTPRATQAQLRISFVTE